MEKILVIDDEPIIRESMTAYLEDSGFMVCQARDGREGLAVFRRETRSGHGGPENAGNRRSGGIVNGNGRIPGYPDPGGFRYRRDSGCDRSPEDGGTGLYHQADPGHGRSGACGEKGVERARLRVENRRYREHLEEEIRCRTVDLVERTRALQESETKLSAIIELFEGLIYTSTRDHRIEFMNRKLMDHIGRDATGEKCHAALFDLTSACPWCVNATGL